MRTSKWIILAALVLAVGHHQLHAQLVRSTPAGDLERGIASFGEGRYEDALRHFEAILLDERREEQHGEAFFWAAKAHLALGDLEFAERNLEHFLAFYPADSRYREAVYQKGRLLFLQEQHENALTVFQSFVEKYPDSEFVPNAYFWAAECLYALGHLDEAEKIYAMVVENYPSSFRVEAARYRLSLIELHHREREILKLLKWSHQETIRLLNDIERRDRTYQEAIAAFRERLASLESGDRAGEIARLTDEVASLKEKLRLRDEEITMLRERYGSDDRVRRQLEAMHGEAVDLRDSYRSGNGTASGGE